MHTPGPWSFYLNEADTAFIVKGDGLIICTPSWHSDARAMYPLKTESEANVRLIAAAPELLAFVAELAAGKNATTRDLPPSIVRDAKALIAKARG